MLNIGCHLSVAKGFFKAGQQAVDIDANTFQFFTRNPRGGKAKQIDNKDVDKLKNLMVEYQFAPLFAHASYTMNLCSNKEETREFANAILADDLERLKQLPKAMYIFHPGSHVGQGVEEGINWIVSALNHVVNGNEQQLILLEGMSGKGTEIGKTFQELKQIIDGVKNNDNLGVCLDTCHLYSAGYDIVNNLDGVLKEVDQLIGLNRIKAIHLNDSKTVYHSNKDRHEVIGGGSIGVDVFRNIINHPKLAGVTFNLETPNELDGYKKEIALLKKLKS